MLSRAQAKCLFFLPAAVLAVAAVSGPVPQDPAARNRPAEPVRYDRDIRPILADRCFTCHGPDPKKREQDLRLDDPQNATAERKGVTAIVPGDLGKSELWRRISTDDQDDVMPPPHSGKRALTAAERELLRAWIEQGAHYEKHWSFVPPVRPAAPAAQEAKWPRNPIDRFVLQNLERHGVTPSPQADPATLARRLYLTLTGLPPTPEEIDAFLADRSPDAVATLTTRLLAEQPYANRSAENFAAPWLDAARYADTIGIHTDAGWQLWPYRDWVLRAFRDNLPYDRFITEQIAGDLLPDSTRAQKVATGFLRAHVTTDEGGAISAEYLVEYAVDRASTVGSVFLGLTVGCARCHEHKYDPISHEDFYRFYSFFNSVDQPGLYSQQPDPNRAHEPFLVVPSPEQEAELARLKAELAMAQQELDQPAPGEAEQEVTFLREARERAGVHWVNSELLSASSAGGAKLTPLEDGSVLVSGPNPARDDHTFTLRTAASDLRLLSLEALEDKSLPEGKVGRAPNGNAVLSGVEVEAISVADPQQRRQVKLNWAWADYQQPNGDFAATNVLSADQLGWAVGAHFQPGGRNLLLLAEESFGFAGGTELAIRLRYQSVYGQHAFGRVRLSVGQIGQPGLDLLPEAASFWYVTGPFPVASGQEAFDKAFGPEQQERLDGKQNFGAGNQTWRQDSAVLDGRLNPLPDGVNVHYLGKRLFAPSARPAKYSIGSDDGFRLFVRGKEVGGKQVERGIAADQDQVATELPVGESLLCLKVVNSGGAAGGYLRRLDREGELGADLVLALLPEAAHSAVQERITQAWRVQFSPGYAMRRARVEQLTKQVADLEAKLPRTLVVKELPEPRPTYVLLRGAYDHPDLSRKVDRGVPAALGTLAPDAPRDRVGLAQWLMAKDNPLVARVAVNRLWQQVFGEGLVRTSGDFGMQGEWPSHPDLLDWLAVELRESGWDLRHVLTLILDSATFRQSSRLRPEVAEHDPDKRWLASFPRRRLTAEQIRDQALYVSGLLVEQLGGPSVKPLQPEGLWQEVAMPASNTRAYRPGTGDDLRRRSLYTYWKRACPPPDMTTFDAPTREFCVVRRISTNTPLQALVLWNDVQFVQAARALAARELAAPGMADDRARIAHLFRRCTGALPDAAQLAALTAALDTFRARFQQAPADAASLIAVEAAPAMAKPMAKGKAKAAKPAVTEPVVTETAVTGTTATGTASAEPVELAAWTLLASACLTLDATLCSD